MNLCVRVMNLWSQDKSERPQFAVTLKLTQIPVAKSIESITAGLVSRDSGERFR